MEINLTGALFTLLGIIFTLIGNLIINIIKNRLDMKGLAITAEEKLRADLQEIIDRLDKENALKDERIDKMEDKYAELSIKVYDLTRENYNLKLELDEERFNNQRLDKRAKELESKVKELQSELDLLRKEKTI